MTKRPVKAVTAIFLAGTLAACAPQFKERPSPFNEITPVNWKEWSGEVSKIALNWHSFDDAELRKLIDEALAHNLDLETSLRNLERAQIRQGTAEGDRLPKISINGNVGRSDDLNSKLPNSARSSFGVSIPASYEIDLWGRRSNRIESTVLSTEIAKINLQTSRISTVARVAELYFQIRAADRKLVLKQRSLKSIKEQRDMIAARVKGGLATGTDKDRQDVQVANLETSIEALKAQRSQQESRLAVLLGRTPQDLNFPAAADYDLKEAPKLSIGAPAEVLRHRPDIKTSELNLAISHIDADLVRTRLFPFLTVSASASVSSNSLENLFDHVNLPWNIASNIAIPLLDGGARKAEIRNAELGLDDQVTRYKSTILNALLDVESALASEASLRRQQKSTERQRRIQERIQKETKAKFNSGRSSSLDLIIEERSLINIEEQEVDLWLQSMQVSISLLRAFGVDPVS